MNISNATRRVLTRYPYLERYMAAGVVNYRALARLISADVEKEVGNRTNIQSIVTALRRESQTRRFQENNRLLKILGRSSVSLRYDMAAITLPLKEEVLKGLRRVLSSQASYILLQGMENLTIVADQETLPKLVKPLQGFVLESYHNLAIVVVKSDKEITRTPGVLAHLANILSLEDINIVEMMSSHLETAFILEERDALKTVEILRREIKRVRTGPSGKEPLRS